MSPPITVAVPGDLQRRTGGYGYDRRLIEELRCRGRRVDVLRLGAGFPFPSAGEREAAAAAFAALPDGTAVIVDGLAGGVLPEVFETERDRLVLVALCHHPLALETGTNAARAEALAASERRTLAAARAIVVTSMATAAILVEDFAVADGGVLVAPPGTDPRPPAPVAGDPPVLLTVASLTPRKGHDLLVDALAAIGDLDWTSRWVGPDDLDAGWTTRLRSMIAARGLGPRVSLLGEVADPSGEYHRADLFVLPSRYEGYGMVFAEALAHGLPVVATRAGAVPDVVPADAGRLVAPGDAVALAAALRDLLSDPAARAAARGGALRAGAALPRWRETADAIAALVDGEVAVWRAGAGQGPDRRGAQAIGTGVP